MIPALICFAPCVAVVMAGWQERVVDRPFQRWAGVAVAGNGAKMLAVANLGGIWLSHHLTTWERVSVPPSVAWRSAASSHNATKMVACVFNGNICRSADSEATWQEVTNIGAFKF